MRPAAGPLPKLLLQMTMAVALAGCSARQAYDGLQGGQRAQCVKLSEPERSKCVESTDVRYDEYEQARGK